MKPIRSLLSLALLACATAQAAPADVAPATSSTSTAAGAVAAAPTTARIKCIRGQEIGSNRTKRICLPDDRLKALTPEERADLFRSERSAAEVLEN